MSFAELLVVLVVGLLVIGPDRLPEAIRTSIRWFTKIKRALNDARIEFEQQLGVDDIRRELHNEQVMESLRKLEENRKIADDSVREVGEKVNEALQEAQKHSAAQADSSTDKDPKDAQ